MVPDIALVTEDQVIWPWLIFFYDDVTRTGSMDSPSVSLIRHSHIIYMYIFHGAASLLPLILHDIGNISTFPKGPLLLLLLH